MVAFNEGAQLLTEITWKLLLQLLLKTDKQYILEHCLFVWLACLAGMFGWAACQPLGCLKVTED